MMVNTAAKVERRRASRVTLRWVTLPMKITPIVTDACPIITSRRVAMNAAAARKERPALRAQRLLRWI